MKAKIVIGSLFGDEGKGITTDFLCNKNNAGNTIVVRFSGGQQAGHNVRIGDKTHIHSNFGSGALRDFVSYFTEHCTIYPVTMFREETVLYSKGVYPIVSLHPLSMVTTPGDVAFNRYRELKVRHGSCGIGVGSTMTRNIDTPYKLYSIDLKHPKILFEKLNNIYWYYRGQIEQKDIKYFNEVYVEEFLAFEEAIKNLIINIRSYDYLKYFNNIIFEGSQGILLDMDHGFFPHVTYANTTSKNALDICKKLKIRDIEIYYVTRCYQTRHGNGWMSNTDKIDLINNDDEINIHNEWQGHFRIGEIDYDLLNYSLSIDDIYSKGITKNLVVTCLDQRPDFNFEYDKLNYRFSKIFESYSSDSSFFREKILDIKEKTLSL